MKQKLIIVLILLVAVFALALFGLVPGERPLAQTGDVVKYFPESDFGAGKYKECCGGSGEGAETHSTRIQDLLDIKLEDSSVDYASLEGSFFDLYSEDSIYVGQQAFWFIRSDVEDPNTNDARYSAIVSVPELRRSRTNLDPYTVLEDVPKQIRGMTVIADHVVDVDASGRVGDWARLVLPGVSTVTYSPMLSTGDVRLVNGKEVELVSLRPSSNVWETDKGVAVVRVGTVVGTIDAYTHTEVGGLNFILDTVYWAEDRATLYIDDVFTVEL